MSSLAETVLNSIARRDYSLMRKVQKWPAPKWIRLWMICATRGGDGWLWYIMGAFLLIFGGTQGMLVAAESASPRHRNHPFPGLETRHGPPSALRRGAVLLVQTIAARPVFFPLRPYYYGLRGLYSDSAAISHAAPGILFCAVSIAASRIILGMHFLSDVVAGGAIGWMLAWPSGNCSKPRLARSSPPPSALSDSPDHQAVIP